MRPLKWEIRKHGAVRTNTCNYSSYMLGTEQRIKHVEGPFTRAITVARLQKSEDARPDHCIVLNQRFSNYGSQPQMGSRNKILGSQNTTTAKLLYGKDV